MNTQFARRFSRVLFISFMLFVSYATILAGSVNLDGFSAPISENQKVLSVSSEISYSLLQAGKTYVGAVVIDIKPGWHINSVSPLQSYLIAANLEIDTIPGLTPLQIKYPKADFVPLLGEQMSVYQGRTAIYFQVAVAENAPDGDLVLPIRFTYQPCNNEQCLAPATDTADLKITVGQEGVAVNAELFSDVTFDAGEHETATDGAAPVQEQTDLERLIAKYGFWGYLLALGLAFMTGLLLSFSPCTYPMIPITVSVFAGQNRSMGRGFFLALFYVGTMAVVYGIMGLIVSLVGGVFGAWLASPPIAIGIAIIFVIFSLSMFGLYELNVPMALRQKMGGAKTEGGIVGSIILGAVAALVVSPCVGPFVAGILLYIATYGSPFFGFLVLFVFALGLGTLYLIIGTFSSAITKLPKAGMWMDQIKKFFGFILLLMALYFLRTIIPMYMTAVLTGFLLLAFSVFGGGFDRLSGEDGFFPRLKKFLGIISLLVAIFLILGTVLIRGFILPPVSTWLPIAGNIGTQAHESPIDWTTDLEAGLAQAKASGKPVLIDTWATWCANCKELERITFNDEHVASEAKRFQAIRIQLEKDTSPETKDFMQRFGLKTFSLPTVLLLDSQGNVKKVMKGLVKPEGMIAEMQKVR